MSPIPRRAIDALARWAEAPLVRAALFTGLALALTWPALETAGQMNFFRDAQVLMHYEQQAVRSLVEHGELPLWDPWYCGGVYALGTPQSRFAAPTFLLSLVFGALRAEALTVFAMLALGMEGAYRYARSYGAGPVGALLAAPIFAASGNFATSFFHGWINFYGFALVPWVGWGARRILREERPSGVVVMATGAAFILGFGGTYAAPLTAVLCAFELLTASGAWLRAPRRARVPLGLLASAAAFAIGLSALRLLPLLETLAVADRLLADRPGLPIEPTLAMLFGELGFHGNNLRNLDGAFYIGALCLPAALLGAARFRAWPLVAGSGLFLWMATGYAHGWSPFVGLRELPLFSSLRYPERYLILLALFVAVLAAVGVSRLLDASRRRPLWLLPAAAVIGALLANLGPMMERHHAPVAHMELVAPPAHRAGPFHQARGNRWALGYYTPLNRGSLSCWDAYPVPMSPLLRADLPAEEYLVDPEAGSVERRTWSPHRVALRAALEREGRVRVNQNWHPGWRASVGRVISDQGLLAVDLPRGEHDVVLSFAPRSAIAGGVGTALALLGLCLVWARARRRDRLGARARRRQHALLALAPLLAMGATALALPEEPMRPPSPFTPEGETVLVDELPVGSTRLDVGVGRGLTLVGGQVTPAALRPGDTLTVELDFRRTGEVPPGAGVFVHLRGPGAPVNLDHMRLSEALEVAALPEDRVARDILRARLPADMTQGQWTVWAGVWDALGDRERLPLTPSEHATTDAHDRVQVGRFVVREAP